MNVFSFIFIVILINHHQLFKGVLLLKLSSLSNKLIFFPVWSIGLKNLFF